MNLNEHINASDAPSAKKEWLIVLLIILVVTGLEFLLRAIQQDLSGNIRHIAQIPEVAQSFDDDDSFHILFLGNSLTYDAIDAEMFERELSNRYDHHFNVRKVAPDSTSLWDWSFIAKHNFSAQEVEPDLLIVGFTPHHVNDREAPDPSRLASNYCRIGDVVHLYRLGMTAPEDLLEFLAADASTLFANRVLVRSRILDRLIPDYRSVAQSVNAQSVTASMPRSGETTYARLASFLTALENGSSRSVFVAMPLMSRYELDSEIRAVINREADRLLDLRNVSGISTAQFKDVMHLNPEGSEVFTRSLVEAVAHSEIFLDALENR